MNKLLVKTLDYHGTGYDLLRIFRNEPYVFLLDSQMNRSCGRYSFLGFDPFELYKDKGRNFLPHLRKLFSGYPVFKKSPTPFPCGVMGYFAYDLGLYLENVKVHSMDDLLLPDGFFGFYDCILTIDHLRKKLIVTSSGLPERSPALRETRAAARLQKILERLSGLKQSSALARSRRVYIDDRVKFKSNFTVKQYVRSIGKIMDLIRRGDLYQVNLSQRFELKRSMEKDGWLDLYEAVSRFSPSDFSAYFDCGNFRLISSSPERFLHLSGSTVETRPMKGTRSRGKSEAEDRDKRRDLLQSAKDRAELLMITDLGRNDLGKVCDFGSVQVKKMRTIESYRTVYQATSTVTGRLRKDKDAFDVIEACFPGGSVTGCPKIRAMETIELLEPTRRGVYTGALGYLSFSGEMDLNILIRTLLERRGTIYLQTGGGIVADSNPRHEFNETLTKAKALAFCLEKTGLK